MPQLGCGTAEYIYIYICMYVYLSFIVSDFTFRTTIYFKLVFVYSVNNGFKFCFIVFLNLIIQLFQHHLLKRLCFLLYIAFVKKKKKQPLIYMGLFLYYILFHLSVYLLMPYCTLDYYRFVLSLEIKES